jgi:hypothetical protein
LWTCSSKKPSDKQILQVLNAALKLWARVLLVVLAKPSWTLKRQETLRLKKDLSSPKV